MPWDKTNEHGSGGAMGINPEREAEPFDASAATTAVGNLRSFSSSRYGAKVGVEHPGLEARNALLDRQKFGPGSRDLEDNRADESGEVKREGASVVTDGSGLLGESALNQGGFRRTTVGLSHRPSLGGYPALSLQQRLPCRDTPGRDINQRHGGAGENREEHRPLPSAYPCGQLGGRDCATTIEGGGEQLLPVPRFEERTHTARGGRSSDTSENPTMQELQGRFAFPPPWRCLGTMGRTSEHCPVTRTTRRSGST